MLPLTYSFHHRVIADIHSSDWTRYASTTNASLFGQGITCPLTIILTALLGLITTSATQKIYSTTFWNPFELLLYIQSQSMSPATRAGTFFSGLCFLASQMALCIVLNAMSTGMDMAALCPRWINIRRGCFILTIIAVAICPWNFVNSASTFITVLSGWSIFLSGMTGILVVDYFFVRRGELHLADMYQGGRQGAYWYTWGVNWRAVLAWAMGVWPLLRMLISCSFTAVCEAWLIVLSRIRPSCPNDSHGQWMGSSVRSQLLLWVFSLRILALGSAYTISDGETDRVVSLRDGASSIRRTSKRGGRRRSEDWM